MSEHLMTDFLPFLQNAGVSLAAVLVGFWFVVKTFGPAWAEKQIDSRIESKTAGLAVRLQALETRPNHDGEFRETMRRVADNTERTATGLEKLEGWVKDQSDLLREQAIKLAEVAKAQELDVSSRRDRRRGDPA